MKTPSFGTLSFAILGLAALVLVAIGPPGSRPIQTNPVAATPPPSVSAGGFTLVSTSVDFPVDDDAYPDGPHADVINANCTSCHSASMARTQPRLSPEQWTAIVKKMRETYKAPVAETDVPTIVAYLTAMSRKLGAEPNTGASGRAPSLAAGKDVTG
ncbi:MAG: hypothetical protein WC729_26515 [Sphingomonas sp.]|jgi:hypothetical protein|uniref:hypothetical protein n=1 Tax=Sphingomonas sp. TaxID=28214 RepID=UPI0035675CCD